MAKLKLTEREIEALVSKVKDKIVLKQKTQKADAAKKLLPRARSISKSIMAIPDEVMEYLYENRYAMPTSALTDPIKIAETLVKKTPEMAEPDTRNIKADIVLVAHNCTTMQQLCAKLGI